MMTKKKRKNDMNNKPLISMEKHEYDRAMREITRPIDEAILAEPFNTRVVFVRWVKTGKPVFAALEYGDGEGVRSATEFAQDCVAERLVKIGELHVVVGELLT